ncbi:MAG: glycosyltransferase family 4 protein [Pirellulaceae bacterium]
MPETTPLFAFQNPSLQPTVEPLDCRVVTLTHYLPPYMARVLYYTAQQIRDFRVLLSIEEEPNRHFGTTWDGLKVKVQKSIMIRRPWKHGAGFQDELFVHFPYDTISQLRRARPDIVFSYELGFRSLTSAIYCKTHRKKLALCVCASEHTEQGRGFARNILRRLLLRSADAVTYNGPSCRAYLEGFRVRDERLFHFPYACSDLFRYVGRLERAEAAARRLLCIGQLTQRKGVVPLLNSLVKYCSARPHRRVEIDFIGTGTEDQALRDVALPDNLHMRLVGHLSQQDIAQAMEHAGILVFPTLADEWGLVVNEALQAGMPVVGSQYAQACTALIHEGENGWLYCPDVDESLFETLDKLYSLDDSQLLAMRQAAQRCVAEITPQNVARSAIDMFGTLLRK